MELITWRNEFSVGVPELDEQHKQLVALINAFHQAMLLGTGSAVLRSVLLDLTAYTKMHFETEERILQELQFPDFEAHRKKHQSFRDQVASFRKNLALGSEVLNIDFMTFLRTWLEEHLLAEDGKYAQWIQTNGDPVAKNRLE